MVLRNEDKVSITSGDIRLNGFTVTENGQVFEPEAIKLKRGPYNIHMSVVETPSDFTVQQIKVEKTRPALLGPNVFANIESAKQEGAQSIEELRAI